MLPLLVHKIFTFYINGVLNCIQLQGQRVYSQKPYIQLIVHELLCGLNIVRKKVVFNNFLFKFQLTLGQYKISAYSLAYTIYCTSTNSPFS